VAQRAVIVAELRVINADLLQAASTTHRDVARVFELDYDFHRRTVVAGAGPRLLTLHESFKPQSERYGRIYSSALIDEIGTSVDEHEAVIVGIEAGDPDAAEGAMRRNWSNASQRLARVIDSLGELYGDEESAE
jgi:DNA-binding GntR family transcriptional regulator